MSGFVNLEDLGGEWRVDVRPGFLLNLKESEMRPSFTAQLLSRTDSGRWRKVGPPVLNDAPTNAVRDLLAALDGGLLPERAS